jgi:serine protease Do
MRKVLLLVGIVLALAPSAYAQGPGSEIGASVRELSSQEISAQRPAGVYVQDVRPDSPASRAGLRAGDIVVEFDGERVRSTRQFTRLVRETPPGRAVNMAVARGTAQQMLEVTPRESRGMSIEVPDFSREIERRMRALPGELDVEWPFSSARTRLGLSLTPLSTQLAAYFGVTEGVLVSEVEADSPAARAGVRAGDVLTAVAGRTVNDPSDVRIALREAAAGATVEIRLVRDRKEVTVKAALPEARSRTARSSARPRA